MPASTPRFSSRLPGSTRLVVTLLLAWLAAPIRPAVAADASPPPAAAATAPPAVPAYALLVASHRPGPGQQPLRFAAEDAARVQAVLTELGGYDPTRVQLLIDPTRARLEQALAQSERQLRAHQQAGEPAVFLYYYSGHARARALALGEEELPLPVLRQRLEGLPATLRLVVLDACQSGAISGVKGAEPAADFSFNSVAGLNTSGSAVLASSSASELSQESARLGGSFFTHHLVVGLRGAADADTDGRVTLAEAYRYAYDRTLVATAQTAVGKQHVTLQTELRGRGEMVLTTPAQATGRLLVPAPLRAELLLQRVPGPAVVAELHKVAGEAVQLALPPGSYEALVRRDERLERCPLTLTAGQPLTLSLGGCRAVPTEVAAAKGALTGPPDDDEPRWALEAGVGLLVSAEDDYVGRLADFGFERADLWDNPAPNLSLAVLRRLDPRLQLGLALATLDHGHFSRARRSLQTSETVEQRFDWTSYGAAARFRAGWPLAGGHLLPYLQADAGVVLGRTRLSGGLPEVEDQQDFWGWQLAAATGLQAMFGRHLGLVGEAAWILAPVVENLLDDTHDSGGLALRLGLRVAW